MGQEGGWAQGGAPTPELRGWALIGGWLLRPGAVPVSTLCRLCGRWLSLTGHIGPLIVHLKAFLGIDTVPGKVPGVWG